MERATFILRAGDHAVRRLGEIRAEGWRLESFRTASAGWLRSRRPAGLEAEVAALRPNEVVTLLVCVRGGGCVRAAG